jgi:hypothetical protein
LQKGLPLDSIDEMTEKQKKVMEKCQKQKKELKRVTKNHKEKEDAN